MIIKSRMLWFLSGSFCFIISQPLLRLPILQRLQQSTAFLLTYTLNPLLIGILIAFSAGVFEEGFRFLFKRFLIRPDYCEFSQPVIFGLGHGVAEALFILIPALASVHISQLGIAALERVLAVILHINLTVIVWNGFQKNKKLLYLLFAVIIHGLINSLIPILSSLKYAVLLIEGILLISDILLTLYSWNFRKHYKALH